MKDFITKSNISGGDDSASVLEFGAKAFNSISDENKNAVISSGQTLTTGQADDTKTDQLARALAIAGQSASSYTDSGVANAYALTSTLATLVQPEAYYNGMKISFTPNIANTGTSTINVSSLGLKAIRTVVDADITVGVLLITRVYNLVYISSYAGGSGAFVIDNSLAVIDSDISAISALFTPLTTFTPTATTSVGSVTLSVSEGSYTKSGNMVTVNAHIEINTTTASGDSLWIGNLPYSAAYESQASIRLTFHTAYATANMEKAWIVAGESRVTIQGYDGVNGTTTQFPANLLSGTDIYVTINYLTSG